MTVRKLVLADLVMLIKDATISARVKNTTSKRGHVGYLTTFTYSDGTEAVWVRDTKRSRWIKWRIKEQDLDPETAGPHLLELKGPGGRYKPFAEWIKDEENLRDIAVAMVDLECGVEDGNRSLIEAQEDELREHFGLEPFNRPAPHIGKPAMI